jgi:NAD-dependent aldehyde dehydrogenases
MQDVLKKVDSQFIAGQWRPAEKPQQVEILNPSTEERLAMVAAATVGEVEDAIRAARAAFDEGPWPRMSQQERSAALVRFAEALKRRRDTLVEIAVRQTGAVLSLARSLQTDFVIDAAFRYADLARTYSLVEHVNFTGQPFAAANGQTVRLVQRAPAGVVAAITPFNYPFMMNVQKVFPPLAMGCTVVLKPTPITCLDAICLADAAEEAELPPGVLSVLLGGGPEVGEAMASHPAVDVVTFTGSTAVGRRIIELSAPTVKKLVLELGGKSPNIVFADADLDAFLATDPGNLRHAGQGCGQLTRLLVERPIYEQVVERIAERMRGLVVGDAADPATEVGPVISRRQQERILDYIESGRSDGARLVCGGGRPSHLERGFFVEPTLFADVDNSMRIAREEIFGPVPVVIPFDGPEEAVRIANDSMYGLNASVWTTDRDKAFAVGSRLLSGNVGINCLANVMEGPHGGFKQSGNGREWWQWSLAEYTELRGFSYSA